MWNRDLKLVELYLNELYCMDTNAVVTHNKHTLYFDTEQSCFYVRGHSDTQIMCLFVFFFLLNLIQN